MSWLLGCIVVLVCCGIIFFVIAGTDSHRDE